MLLVEIKRNVERKDSMMYSESDRKNILDKIVMICKGIDAVDGVILVGSGAEGFTDKWSDIDLSVVTSNEDKTRHIWKEINKLLDSAFNIMKISCNEYGENNYLSALMLNNYLEIDIGVISIKNLVAKRKEWVVLYDKSGNIIEKMNTSWNERKIQAANVLIEDNLNGIWYHIKNGAFALKREKIYRAVKELEELRNHIVEIKSLEENKIAKHFRDVDNMDRLFLNKLEKTFFSNISREELTRAFINSFDLYFDVVKAVGENFEEIIKYEKELRGLLQELDLI
jgi:predicted nucleotidyltransferase